jgi:hypothetical protein
MKSIPKNVVILPYSDSMIQAYMCGGGGLPLSPPPSPMPWIQLQDNAEIVWTILKMAQIIEQS